MNMNSATWGHVALPDAPFPPALSQAHEQCEMHMLRCRYGRIRMKSKSVSLCGFLPDTDTVILNPNTLKDLADIFEMDVTQAFA